MFGFEVFYAFLWVFISCELGDQFSSSFLEVGSAIDCLNWYAFSIEVQQMLPFVIAIAQRPVALEVFGSVLCLRTSFKSVSAIVVT